MIILEDVIGDGKVSVEAIEVLNNYIEILNRFGTYSKQEQAYFSKIHNNFPEIKPLMIKALQKKELFEQGCLL